MERKKEKYIKNKAKKLLLAATATSSLLVNSAFDGIPDIIEDSEDDCLEDEVKTETKQTLKAKTKALLGKLPFILKVFILIPLYLIGAVLMFVLKPIWESIISVLLSKLCEFAIIALIMVALLFITTLILFPNVPLFKKFNKKTISMVIIGVLIVGILDKILSSINEDYDYYSSIVKFTGSLLTLLPPVIYIFKKTRFKHIILSTDKYVISSN